MIAQNFTSTFPNSSYANLLENWPEKAINNLFSNIKLKIEIDLDWKSLASTLAEKIENLRQNNTLVQALSTFGDNAFNTPKENFESIIYNYLFTTLYIEAQYQLSIQGNFTKIKSFINNGNIDELNVTPEIFDENYLSDLLIKTVSKARNDPDYKSLLLNTFQKLNQNENPFYSLNSTTPLLLKQVVIGIIIILVIVLVVAVMIG